jgi:flagellum-specific ATP synthase
MTGTVSVDDAFVSALAPTRGRLARAIGAARPRRVGRVSSVLGMQLEVQGLDVAIGDAVEVTSPAGSHDVPLVCEVIALRADAAVCMPFGSVQGLRAGARAVAVGEPATVPAGRGLLGRVLDGLGRPLDGGPPLDDVVPVAIDHDVPHPLRRTPVDRPLPVGVRAIDTLVPVGRGQRLGIFAGSGVGKSSLLSMIVRGTEADVSVLALIGERGREVRDFVDHDLGPEGLARSVVVVATSDQPALVRLRAAFTATRIAEWFRDQGSDALLLMDSVTRFAMAQREVGLSAGEPPATRGYPPSVFGMLPRLLERAGTSERGSITGLYTVLVEGDDMNEPIGDAARSILDGHVVLTRALATAGHFPSIDVLESVSRVSGAVTTAEQRAAATAFRRLLAAHRDARDLIDIGAYVPGSNPLVDLAVERRAAMDAFLRQPLDAPASATEAWDRLARLVPAELVSGSGIDG